MKITLLIAVLAIAGSSLAIAQDPTPAPAKKQTIGERQVHQKARIKEGVKSGELDAKEAARLKAEQQKIQAEKKVAKADGQVTKEERTMIKHDQNKASRHIYKQKHDAQKAK